MFANVGATDPIPSIKAFIRTLEPDAQQEYASVLATYRQHGSRLEAMRSNGVFHYPAWNPTRGAIRHGLATAGHSLGIVKIQVPTVEVCHVRR